MLIHGARVLVKWPKEVPKISLTYGKLHFVTQQSPLPVTACTTALPFSSDHPGMSMYWSEHRSTPVRTYGYSSQLLVKSMHGSLMTALLLH